MATVVRRMCDFVVQRRSGRSVVCEKPVPGNESTLFWLHGTEYSVDLCEEHVGALEDALAPFVGVATQARSLATKKRGRMVIKGPKGKTITTKEVRAWALANGRDVQEGGRVANSVIEEYKEYLAAGGVPVS